MAFQITGKIELIGEITTKASKNGGQPFQSREFVLDATRFNPDTGEPWENHPKFELSSRNVNIIDGFQIGQRVTVDFTLRGAKYADKETGEIKYFTSISAFRITPAEQQQGQAQQGQVQQPAQAPAAAPQPAVQPAAQPFPPQVDESGNPVSGNADDLPF